MLNNSNWLCFLILGTVAATCVAQETVPPKFYRLEFVAKEVDGTKVLNSRTYSTIVSTKNRCVIRTSSKVATPTSKDGTNYSYQSLGVNIDCNSVMEVQNALSLTVAAEVSSLLQETTMPANPAAAQPVIRENRWDSAVIVPLKKPTVIFSSDDLTTKHQMQLELTATPIT